MRKNIRERGQQGYEKVTTLCYAGITDTAIVDRGRNFICELIEFSVMLVQIGPMHAHVQLSLVMGLQDCGTVALENA